MLLAMIRWWSPPTGWGSPPLFPASNLVWALRPVPAAAELLALVRLRVGTVDAWFF